MAGLGTNVGTSFAVKASMSGSVSVGGSTVPVWLFTPQTGATTMGFMGDRFLPSVHFEPIEGQVITLDFNNQSPMAHTIHLHGLDVDQMNDGVPSTSFTVNPFTSTTYTFTAPHAGTYHYHCHVDTVIHYARGMWGTVIVRPPGGSTTQAWTGGPTFDEEVLWQLSTVDTAWNSLVFSGSANARYNANGFLLNGKESAGALTDAFTKVSIAVGEKAYIRVLNGSYEWARVSLAGRMFDVVASDGRPMLTPQTTGVLELGPGERYDILLTGTQVESYNAQIDYLDDISGAVKGSVQTAVEVT